MFNQLSNKILGTLNKLKGQPRIKESNIVEALQDIKMSLLEADVHFKVVKHFVEEVKKRALGKEVLESVSAGQQFVKILHEEMVRLLSVREGEPQQLDLRGKESPQTLMLMGLQGVGKTTTAAKLARYLQEKIQKKTGLLSVDVYRPAALDQLQKLAQEAGLLCYPSSPKEKPLALLKKAKKWAVENRIELLVVDTAGRTQLDTPLMKELNQLNAFWPARENLLVVDAMLGQQSVEVAQGFCEHLKVTGLILTKIDGDARGGAAFSIRYRTGLPIRFMTSGEKISDFQVFHPDRIASRILDMGDVLTFVEKAQEVIGKKTQESQIKRIKGRQFTLEDFLVQVQQMEKMGGISSLIQFLPGMKQAMKQVKSLAPAEKEMKNMKAIISSMTLNERRDHRVLNASRRIRIAKGSGTRVQDVNSLVKKFEQAQKMMKHLFKSGLGRGGFGGGGGLGGGGFGGFGGGGLGGFGGDKS